MRVEAVPAGGSAPIPSCPAWPDSAQAGQEIMMLRGGDDTDACRDPPVTEADSASLSAPAAGPTRMDEVAALRRDRAAKPLIPPSWPGPVGSVDVADTGRAGWWAGPGEAAAQCGERG